MKTYLKLILIIITFNAYGQSDDCAGAVTLTSNLTCSATNGNTSSGFTDSGVGCATGNEDDDGWYKFVAVSTSQTVFVNGAADFDAVLAAYTSCTATTSPTGGGCVDASADNGNETLNLTGLTIGNTYFIKVHDRNAGGGNFTICVTGTPPLTNDECTGAINLPVNASCSYSVYSNTGASTSSTTGTPAPGCASYSGNDVWFKFTVPASGEVTVNTNTGTLTDIGMAWYSGSCGSLTLLECDDDDSENGSMSKISRTGLTPGNVIFVRVWDYGGTENGTFSICASQPPVSGCNTATSLACGTTNLAGTTVGATAAVHNSGCTMSDYGKWYTFTGDGQQTTISTDAGAGFDQEISIASGACATLSNIECIDNDGSGGIESYTFTTTVGTVYYVYLAYYSTTGTSAETGTFTISRTCNAVPPSGCSSAAPLNCGTSNLAGTTVGVTAAASNIGCSISDYGKWYTFNGDDQQSTINISPAAGYDVEIAIASGSCGTLSNIDCIDNGGSGSVESISFPTISGTTYYLYVAYYSNTGTATNTGTFTITRNCGAVVTTTNTQDCSGSTQICSDQSFVGNSDGSGDPDLNATNEGCADENQSSWYFFSPLTAGTLSFTIQTNVDYDFAIWGPYNSKICPPSTAPVKCSFAAEYGNTGLNNTANDNSEGSGGDRWVSPLTVAAGDVNKIYILLIDNFWATSDPFTIDFSLSNGLTLNCVPLPIELINFVGYNKDNENLLFWRTSSERENDYFVIERSIDGQQWTEVEKIKGSGNSIVINEYKYVDEYYSKGLNYYRLSQVDFNGNKTMLNIISIDNTLKSKRSISKVNYLGQTIDDNYKGLIIELFDDGSTVKRFQ